MLESADRKEREHFRRDSGAADIGQKRETDRRQPGDRHETEVRKEKKSDKKTETGDRQGKPK